MLEPGPIYPILDCKNSGEKDFIRLRRLALAVAEGGARLLQLRAKQLPDQEFLELATNLVESLTPLGCRLIVNDRSDVAIASGAAGVHLGDQDLPASDARALLGADAVIGYSTHSLSEVDSADALPVDYLGFGPVFESPTKAGVRSPRGIDKLREACNRCRLPVVAIGGLDIRRAPEAWAAGARSVAVISELEKNENPRDLVQRYLQTAGDVPKRGV